MVPHKESSTRFSFPEHEFSANRDIHERDSRGSRLQFHGQMTDTNILDPREVAFSIRDYIENYCRTSTSDDLMEKLSFCLSKFINSPMVMNVIHNPVKDEYIGYYVANHDINLNTNKPGLSGSSNLKVLPGQKSNNVVSGSIRLPASSGWLARINEALQCPSRVKSGGASCASNNELGAVNLSESSAANYPHSSSSVGSSNPSQLPGVLSVSLPLPVPSPNCPTDISWIHSGQISSDVTSMMDGRWACQIPLSTTTNQILSMQQHVAPSSTNSASSAADDESSSLNVFEGDIPDFSIQALRDIGGSLSFLRFLAEVIGYKHLNDHFRTVTDCEMDGFVENLTERLLNDGESCFEDDNEDENDLNSIFGVCACGDGCNGTENKNFDSMRTTPLISQNEKLLAKNTVRDLLTRLTTFSSVKNTTPSSASQSFKLGTLLVVPYVNPDLSPSPSALPHNRPSNIDAPPFSSFNAPRVSTNDFLPFDNPPNNFNSLFINNQQQQQSQIPSLLQHSSFVVPPTPAMPPPHAHDPFGSQPPSNFPSPRPTLPGQTNAAPRASCASTSRQTIGRPSSANTFENASGQCLPRASALSFVLLPPAIDPFTANSSVPPVSPFVAPPRLSSSSHSSHARYSEAANHIQTSAAEAVQVSSAATVQTGTPPICCISCGITGRFGLNPKHFGVVRSIPRFLLSMQVFKAVSFRINEAKYLQKFCQQHAINQQQQQQQYSEAKAVQGGANQKSSITTTLGNQSGLVVNNLNAIANNKKPLISSTAAAAAVGINSIFHQPVISTANNINTPLILPQQQHLLPSTNNLPSSSPPRRLNTVQVSSVTDFPPTSPIAMNRQQHQARMTILSGVASVSKLITQHGDAEESVQLVAEDGSNLSEEASIVGINWNSNQQNDSKIKFDFDRRRHYQTEVEEDTAGLVPTLPDTTSSSNPQVLNQNSKDLPLHTTTSISPPSNSKPKINRKNCNEKSSNRVPEDDSLAGLKFLNTPEGRQVLASGIACGYCRFVLSCRDCNKNYFTSVNSTSENNITTDCFCGNNLNAQQANSTVPMPLIPSFFPVSPPLSSNHQPSPQNNNNNSNSNARFSINNFSVTSEHFAVVNDGHVHDINNAEPINNNNNNHNHILSTTSNSSSSALCKCNSLSDLLAVPAAYLDSMLQFLEIASTLCHPSSQSSITSLYHLTETRKALALQSVQSQMLLTIHKTVNRHLSSMETLACRLLSIVTRIVSPMYVGFLYIDDPGQRAVHLTGLSSLAQLSLPLDHPLIAPVFARQVKASALSGKYQVGRCLMRKDAEVLRQEASILETLTGIPTFSTMAIPLLDETSNIRAIILCVNHFNASGTSVISPSFLQLYLRLLDKLLLPVGKLTTNASGSTVNNNDNNNIHSTMNSSADKLPQSSTPQPQPNTFGTGSTNMSFIFPSSSDPNFHPSSVAQPVSNNYMSVDTAIEVATKGLGAFLRAAHFLPSLDECRPLVRTVETASPAAAQPTLQVRNWSPTRRIPGLGVVSSSGGVTNSHMASKTSSPTFAMMNNNGNNSVVSLSVNNLSSLTGFHMVESSSASPTPRQQNYLSPPSNNQITTANQANSNNHLSLNQNSHSTIDRNATDSDLLSILQAIYVLEPQLSKPLMANFSPAVLTSSRNSSSTTTLPPANPLPTLLYSSNPFNPHLNHNHNGQHHHNHYPLNNINSAANSPLRHFHFTSSQSHSHHSPSSASPTYLNWSQPLRPPRLIDCMGVSSLEDSIFSFPSAFHHSSTVSPLAEAFVQEISKEFPGTIIKLATLHTMYGHRQTDALVTSLLSHSLPSHAAVRGRHSTIERVNALPSLSGLPAINSSMFSTGSSTLQPPASSLVIPSAKSLFLIDSHLPHKTLSASFSPHNNLVAPSFVAPRLLISKTTGKENDFMPRSTSLPMTFVADNLTSNGMIGGVANYLSSNVPPIVTEGDKEEDSDSNASVEKSSSNEDPRQHSVSTDTIEKVVPINRNTLTPPILDNNNNNNLPGSKVNNVRRSVHYADDAAHSIEENLRASKLLPAYSLNKTLLPGNRLKSSDFSPNSTPRDENHKATGTAKIEAAAGTGGITNRTAHRKPDSLNNTDMNTVIVHSNGAEQLQNERSPLTESQKKNDLFSENQTTGNFMLDEEDSLKIVSNVDANAVISSQWKVKDQPDAPSTVKSSALSPSLSSSSFEGHSSSPSSSSSSSSYGSSMEMELVDGEQKQPQYKGRVQGDAFGDAIDTIHNFLNEVDESDRTKFPQMNHLSPQIAHPGFEVGADGRPQRKKSNVRYSALSATSDVDAGEKHATVENLLVDLDSQSHLDDEAAVIAPASTAALRKRRNANFGMVHQQEEDKLFDDELSSIFGHSNVCGSEGGMSDFKGFDDFVFARRSAGETPKITNTMLSSSIAEKYEPGNFPNAASLQMDDVNFKEDRFSQAEDHHEIVDGFPFHNNHLDDDSKTRKSRSSFKSRRSRRRSSALTSFSALTDFKRPSVVSSSYFQQREDHEVSDARHRHQQYYLGSKQKAFLLPFQKLELDAWAYTESEWTRMFIYSLRDLRVSQSLGLDESKIRKFHQLITASYKQGNAFHNAHHAVHVSSVAYRFLRSYGCGVVLTPLDQLAVMAAAVAHDVDHPGTTNDFLINTENLLAITYNDDAVLENYHAAFCFRLLQLRPEADFRYSLDFANRCELRKTMLKAILATDMKVHFKAVEKITQRASRNNNKDGLFSPDVMAEAAKRFGLSLNAADLVMSAGDQSLSLAQPQLHASYLGNLNETADGVPRVSAESDLAGQNRNWVADLDDRLLLVETIVHSADISNPVIPSPYNRWWASLVFQEFAVQVERERAESVPVTAHMDVPHEAARIQMQINFLSYVVLPHFKAVSLLIPASMEMFKSGECNVAEYRKLLMEHNDRLASVTKDVISRAKERTLNELQDSHGQEIKRLNDIGFNFRVVSAEEHASMDIEQQEQENVEENVEENSKVNDSRKDEILIIAPPDNVDDIPEEMLLFSENETLSLQIASNPSIWHPDARLADALSWTVAPSNEGDRWLNFLPHTHGAFPIRHSMVLRRRRQLERRGPALEFAKSLVAAVQSRATSWRSQSKGDVPSWISSDHSENEDEPPTKRNVYKEAEDICLESMNSGELYFEIAEEGGGFYPRYKLIPSNNNFNGDGGASNEPNLLNLQGQFSTQRI